MNTWEYTSLFYYYQGEQHATEEDRMRTAFTIDWLIDQGIEEQELYELVQTYPIDAVSMTYENLPDSLWDCGTMNLRVRGQVQTFSKNLIERNKFFCHNELRTYPKVLPFNMKTFFEPKLRFTVNNLLEYTITTLELRRDCIDVEQWEAGMMFNFLKAKQFSSLGIEQLDIVMYAIDFMREVNDLRIYNDQGRMQLRPEYLEYAEQRVKQRQASHTDKPLWRTQIWHG